MTSQFTSCLQAGIFCSSFHDCALLIYGVTTIKVWDINKTHQEWETNPMKPTHGLSEYRTRWWFHQPWVLPSRQTTRGFQGSDLPLLVGFIRELSAEWVGCTASGILPPCSWVTRAFPLTHTCQLLLTNFRVKAREEPKTMWPGVWGPLAAPEANGWLQMIWDEFGAILNLFFFFSQINHWLILWQEKTQKLCQPLS